MIKKPMPIMTPLSKVVKMGDLTKNLSKYNDKKLLGHELMPSLVPHNMAVQSPAGKIRKYKHSEVGST